MNQTPSQLAPLVVVSGPSGVGKTTVVERLIAESGLKLRRAVTATTRARRPNETHTDYHFWTPEQFQAECDADRMLEWARVFGTDCYGTPRDEVEPYRERGTGVVLVIDVQGAARVREKGLEHLSVFIEPPSFEELEARLRGRKDMTEDRVRRRLDEARRELARVGEFHRRIVNRELPEAVRELERAVRERFHWGGADLCSTN